MKKLYLPFLVSIALVISLLERSIPIPIPVPGSKLGLANIILLTTLVTFGSRDAFVVGILKSLLMVLMIGSVSNFIYSFAAMVTSLVGMSLMVKYTRHFSLIGVSFVGAFLHIVTQLCVAGIILNNFRIFIYLPVLTGLSVFTGYFVGLCSMHLSKALQHIVKRG